MVDVGSLIFTECSLDKPGIIDGVFERAGGPTPSMMLVVFVSVIGLAGSSFLTFVNNPPPEGAVKRLLFTSPPAGFAKRPVVGVFPSVSTGFIGSNRWLVLMAASSGFFTAAVATTMLISGLLALLISSAGFLKRPRESTGVS